MRINILSLFLFAFSLFGTSQVQDSSFYPVISSGELPEEVIASKSKKIMDVVKNNVDSKSKKSSDKKKEKKRKDFAAANALTIDQLMLSGVVLYNDPYSVLLNKIKDELLANNDSLRNKIVVYAVRKAVPNAMTFNDGKVFFNIGLLSYLRNEAEIAYILAHEISHYTCNHSIKRFEKAMDIVPKGYTKDKNDVFELNQFSQENEKEADKKGLALFLQSKYNCVNAIKMFETLEMSEYPVFDYKFPRSWISNSKLFFNSKFELDSIIPITLTSDSAIVELEKKILEDEKKLKR